MKQSIFKQYFLINGKVRTVEGKLVVTMNYAAKTISVTNPVTHDDFTKQVPQHKIEAFVDGKLWDSRLGLDSEVTVEKEVKLMRDNIEKHLWKISNSEPVKSFVDKMKDVGFEN